MRWTVAFFIHPIVGPAPDFVKRMWAFAGGFMDWFMGRFTDRLCGDCGGVVELVTAIQPAEFAGPLQ